MFRKLFYLVSFVFLVSISFPVNAEVFTDDFETPHNYLTDGLGAYDGMLNGTIEVLNASIDRAGSLYFQTVNAVWDPGPGPLLYKEVTGDFVATVKVTDFAGETGAIVEHNDSGIVARDPADDGADDWLSINYFPTWTAFNVRSTDDGVRSEHGQPAGSWTGVDTFALAAEYPYIQLERVGSDFYFRISADGVNFIPLTQETYVGIYDGTQTPLVISRPDLPATLQVGLMNCSYTDNSGYAAFDDFEIVSAEPEPVGPKIAWVSFHGADDEPSGPAADVGFTEASDIGYTDLLKANGYDVSRYITTNAPDPDILNAADLVIISRAVASPGYQNDGATAWNSTITAPMIIMQGYALRSSRMGYTTGTDMPDTTGDIRLTVSDPTHPIFAGIALTDGTMDNPYAGGAVVLPTDGVTVSRGISINNNPADDEGTVLATIAEASADTGPVGGMVIAEWPAGATLTHDGGAGTDVLAGHRLVFLTGSREPSGVTGGDAAGLYDLYPDGEQMLLNAVKYMIPVVPVNPGAANLVHSWMFDDGTADDVVGDANGTLVGDAAVVDGQLVLDGNGDWMDMPGDIIAMNTFEGLTIEIMFTSIAGGNTGFHMVTAFGEEGTGDNPGFGYKYVCITPARGDNVSRAMIQTVSMDNDPWSEETGVSDIIEHDDGLPHHMVCTIDNTELAFYIDGVLIGTAALDPPGNSIAGIGTDAAHIGKGVYGVDPLWAGSVDYLNLYNKALSEGEILYLAGERPLVSVENPSFELPGTEKIKGWNGEGVAGTPAVDIPGWSTDIVVADSGVETGFAPTDGEWTAFLMSGDPSVWQLTDHTIGEGDVLELKVDARITWAATAMQMTLYYDDNGVRVPAATDEVILTDDMQEYTLSLSAADLPESVGKNIGIEFSNVSSGDSWIGLDNVRLVLVSE